MYNCNKFIKQIHKSFDDSVFTRIMSRIDEMAFLLYETNNLISKIDISEHPHQMDLGGELWGTGCLPLVW